MSDIKKTERRRLTDLYLRGKEVSLNDSSEEDPIVVWVSKISPIQQKESADRATAVRAATLALKKLPLDAPEISRYTEQIADMSKDEIIDILIASKMQEAELSHEAELASEDEWSNDDYIISLKEAWDSGLNIKYADTPDDIEAKRVYDELNRFTEELNKRIESTRQELADEINELTEEEINKRAIERFIDAEGDYLWLNEFRKWQLYFAVREPDDHKKQYFEGRYEVDELDARILLELVNAFGDVSVEAIEGKD